MYSFLLTLKFWGKFSSSALVNSNGHFLCQILLYTNAVLENLPQNRENIKVKKYTYIFLDTFLCNFMQP